MTAHSVEGVRDRFCNAIGQACYNGATGENLRISRQHDRRHCATGGKAGYEDPATIEAMRDNQRFNHLEDGMGLAGVAPCHRQAKTS